MKLNKLRDDVHKNAVEHGWWEEQRSFGEIIALCHSELSEALEEYRDGKPIMYKNCNETAETFICNPEDESDCSNYSCRDSCDYINDKPEGVGIELADCIIRILDYCGHAEIDIEEAIRIKHEYNKRRSYKHGGKII